MAVRASLLNSVLATPPSGNHRVTAALRPSMLETQFEDVRPMALSGLASGFVAAVALIRLQQLWCLAWLVVDVGLLIARRSIARAYTVRRNAGDDRAEYWARRYAPVSLVACFVLGYAYGFVLDLWNWYAFFPHTWPSFIARQASGFPFNTAHAIGNAALALAVGPEVRRMLERYGKRLRTVVVWA